jgi:hypothetical protein
VYLNEKDAAAKIKRWKLLIQEYNFDIEHIPGSLNIIADHMSRLCDNYKLDHNIDLLSDEFEHLWLCLEEEQQIWALDEEPELTHTVA